MKLQIHQFGGNASQQDLSGINKVGEPTNKKNLPTIILALPFTSPDGKGIRIEENSTSGSVETQQILANLGAVIAQDKIYVGQIETNLKRLKAIYFHALKDQKISEDIEQELFDLLDEEVDSMKLRLIAYVKAEQTGEKLKLKLDNGYIIKDSQGLLSILGFGSILSGKIAQKYIELSGNGGVATQLIDGFSGLTSHEILASFEDQQATIQKYVGEQIQKALKEKKVPIVSGYIPGINGTVRSAQSRYNQRAVNVLVNAVEGSGHTLRT